MARCYTCGNDYEDTFHVVTKDNVYDFDSIECAAHVLAPDCSNCGCRILGHGVQFDEVLFCCVNCASDAGVIGLADHGRTHVIAEVS